MLCTLLTVARCKEPFQIVDHGGVSHTVTWHRSPTRPTRRANGINGFVFINGELEYIHICAFQPCRSETKYASKYAHMPPPKHFHLVTDPPAVAGTAAPSGASQATTEAPPEAPPKAAPEASPQTTTTATHLNRLMGAPPPAPLPAKAISFSPPERAALHTAWSAAEPLPPEAAPPPAKAAALPATGSPSASKGPPAVAGEAHFAAGEADPEEPVMLPNATLAAEINRFVDDLQETWSYTGAVSYTHLTLPTKA